MRQKHNNKGFSLVELLISMALLSIIMLMVVQFMATTTGANKKAKANMKAQTASEEFVGNIFDSMSMANYIRITPYKGIYEQNIGSRKEALEASPISSVSKLCSSRSFAILFYTPATRLVAPVLILAYPTKIRN